MWAGVLRDWVSLMRLNSKWTWGLAWAGLAVVIAVPSLDLFTGKSGKAAALLTSTTEPVKTAAVTTTVTPNGITITPTGTAAPASSGDPVDNYLKTNKALPNYITGANAPSADAPTQVATIDPTPPVVAPVPFPARPPDVDTPAALPPAGTAPQTANVDSSSTPYVIDEPAPATQQAALGQPAGPIPPEPIIDDSVQWHTKSLERYLDQNGLMDNTPSRSTASVTVVNRADSNFDANGFYLSDGPNNVRAERRQRIVQMLNDDSDSGGFSLF
jgi:hypothetical protein